MAAQDAFRKQLEALRPYLVRYAALQLRDAAAAEDAVQEALLAALAGEAGFAGRANLRTWVTGILKHKIVDVIRRQAREPALPEEAEEGLEEFDGLFTRNGHWAERPTGWADPDGALEQAQFFRALELCLERLPARTARVFMMREHLGQETAEICKELGITPTHCWVMLYRARMTLRECLQQTWFGK
ncbi:MAG: sigma-70 family RNA polymerase sigma factor [Betaproteobacteria bacterium]|nr:sigma-70 family RNA polymerase sigma factor [Betaproteobacteria bacterium]